MTMRKPNRKSRKQGKGPTRPRAERSSLPFRPQLPGVGVSIVQWLFHFERDPRLSADARLAMEVIAQCAVQHDGRWTWTDNDLVPKRSFARMTNISAEEILQDVQQMPGTTLEGVADLNASLAELAEVGLLAYRWNDDGTIDAMFCMDLQ